SNDYDLSINRYKKVVHDVVEYESPMKVIAELKAMEAEIAQGITELEGLLA
ncbi:N-6 adenine-specific DNA methylase 3, partial [Achromobacter marplatensis]